jgi:hypothetical protein
MHYCLKGRSESCLFQQQQNGETRNGQQPPMLCMGMVDQAFEENLSDRICLLFRASQCHDSQLLRIGPWLALPFALERALPMRIEFQWYSPYRLSRLGIATHLLEGFAI